MKEDKDFDVIVVGGGHAGTEAALTSARTGAKTLLITHNINTLGELSCNPAIGGIGKSHLVKEIDALGGIMAHAADVAGIQFRILNASKGAAVRATRAQIDRLLYKKAINQILSSQEHLFIFQGSVEDLLIKQEQVVGVITQTGLRFLSKTTILTVGTFLNGKIHVGLTNHIGGRMGELSSIKLANRLRDICPNANRLKTGTPARLDGRTINYSKMKIQPGDQPTPVFSFLGSVEQHPKQINCHITNTTKKTHNIIRDAFDRSPLFIGNIQGVGPRYCPSIEDKIVRFADRTSHQIFVEPEGLSSFEVYPNGISTSLPFEVQCDFIRTIPGFEKVHITRPGYAIEYDFFDPRDLKFSLETKTINGLFFAGQINGTTGYEEAAAQGLIAGLNAARQSQGKEPWTPRRDQAYIGVLIDDLVTRGTKEPYRMFTSRAEYRLLLREDNADLRLTEIGRDLSLVDDNRWEIFCKKRESLEREKQILRSIHVEPGTKLGENVGEVLGQDLQYGTNLMDLLKRPKVTYKQLQSINELNLALSDKQVMEQIEIQAKYEGYIRRQQNNIEKQARHENLKIPSDFDYSKINGLSNEVRQKLEIVKPETLGRASRISGITPASISILLIYLKKRPYYKTAKN